MYVASENGHFPVVAALLERGADVEAADEVRLQRGGRSRTWSCALINYPSSRTRMPGGVLLYFGNATGRAFFLIQDGTTPLIIATQEGNLPIVAALLERGANVEAANKVHPQRGVSAGT